MAFISNTPMLSLTAVSGSFPFQTKYLPLVRNSKIILGSEPPATSSGTKPEASTSNGWFSSGAPGSVPPLPVSLSHAEVWWDGRQICIRDLDSAFGTFVNDVKLKDTTVLKTGDIISLGVQISRNGNTPTYITDNQLKSITAKVALAGVAS